MRNRGINRSETAVTRVEKNLSRNRFAKNAIDLSADAKRGAVGKLDRVLAFDEVDNLGGRGKARRDARAGKKVAKKAAPSRKARKSTKQAGKIDIKKTKAEAKVIRAEKSDGTKGMKVLDTINKVVDTAGTVLTGGGLSKSSEAPLSDSEQSAEGKKGFNPLAWYMVVLYLVILALILYFVFKKK